MKYVFEISLWKAEIKTLFLPGRYEPSVGGRGATQGQKARLLCALTHTHTHWERESAVVRPAPTPSRPV